MNKSEKEITDSYEIDQSIFLTNRPTSNWNPHVAYSSDNSYMFSLPLNQSMNLPGMVPDHGGSNLIPTLEGFENDLDILNFESNSIPNISYFSNSNHLNNSNQQLNSPSSLNSNFSPLSLLPYEGIQTPQVQESIETLSTVPSRDLNNIWPFSQGNITSSLNPPQSFSAQPTSFNIEEVFTHSTGQSINVVDGQDQCLDTLGMNPHQSNLNLNLQSEQNFGFLYDFPSQNNNNTSFGSFSGLNDINIDRVENNERGQLIQIVGSENNQIYQNGTNLDSLSFDASSFQNLNGLNISQNQNVFNQVPNPNFFMRVAPPSNIQFTTIDQNYVQQMVNSNVRINFDMGQPQLEQPIQFPAHVLNTQNIIVASNGTSQIVHKIHEPIDLMENPNNWRRVADNGGYQCNICNKCYTRKYGLKIHLRIHSGFKPLECKVCKKKFGDPSNMAKHIRLHSADGSPYKCDLCNKPLVRRRDLERHMRSRHPNSPLTLSSEKLKKKDSFKI